jgi:hypothetical protein
MSNREIHHHHGGATALVFGLGLGAWLVLRDQKAANHHPAAVVAPKPVPTHTVIVQHVTHTITRVAAHSPVSGTVIAVIAVAAILAGIACVAITRGTS